MAASAVSAHKTTVAFFYESTQGTGPANAAAWAAGEGTTVDRFYVTAAPPVDDLVQGAVDDERLTDRVFRKSTIKPIKGLRNVDGVSMQIPLHGSSSQTAEDSQVAETAAMRLLEHCLGGLSRGYTHDITDVTDNTSFGIDTDLDGLEPGQIIALEDSDDTDRLFPRRILTVTGDGDGDGDGDITTDADLPFTLAAGDMAHAVAVAYIDEPALTNPSDANASTVSMLRVEDGQVWEANGGVVQLDGIEFERGTVPKFNFSCHFAYVSPPGDGAPSEPSWTGSVQGDAGLVVGHDLKLHLQAKGTTTEVDLHVMSASLTAGVPRVRREGITEVETGMQGTHGYTTRPEDTLLEVVVDMSTDFQDYWDAGTALVVTLYQIAPDGSGWVVHGSNAILKMPPKPTTGQESILHTMTLEFLEDESLLSTASTTEMARSKLLIGQF